MGSNSILTLFYTMIFIFTLDARLVAFFLGDIACTSESCYGRGSEIFGGTTLLRPGEFTPYLLFSLSHDGAGLGRLLIVPKVHNFLAGSPNILKVLLHNGKQHPGKSEPFLLVYLSHEEQVIDGLVP